MSSDIQQRTLEFARRDKEKQKLEKQKPFSRFDLQDVLLLVIVTAIALLINLNTVAVINSLQYLTGEEASVSVKDVLAVPLHNQMTTYSTNFAGHLFYWVSSYLIPDPDYLYGRTAKAIAMSAISLLTYLTLRRRFDVSKIISFFFSIAVILLPGVASFVWLATENGLECIVGILALYLATTRRSMWIAMLSLPLAALAVSTYGGGLAWAGAVLVAIAIKARLRKEDFDSLLSIFKKVAQYAGLALFTLLSASIVALPLLWWDNKATVLFGGGNQARLPLREAAHYLLDELLLQGGTYYYSNPAPALGNIYLGIFIAACAIIVIFLRPRSTYWIIAAALGGVLCLVSGGPPGLRRAIVISIVGAIVAAIVIDWLVKRLPLPRVIATVLSLAFLVPLIPLQLSYLEGWGKTNFLGQDWVFPLPENRTMTEQVAVLDADLRSGALSVNELARTYDGERALSLVLLPALRSGNTQGLPPLETILELYKEGPRCVSSCTPVEGRI